MSELSQTCHSYFWFNSDGLTPRMLLYEGRFLPVEDEALFQMLYVVCRWIFLVSCYDTPGIDQVSVEHSDSMS